MIEHTSVAEFKQFSKEEWAKHNHSRLIAVLASNGAIKSPIIVYTGIFLIVQFVFIITAHFPLYLCSKTFKLN